MKPSRSQRIREPVDAVVKGYYSRAQRVVEKVENGSGGVNGKNSTQVFSGL